MMEKTKMRIQNKIKKILFPELKGKEWIPR